MQFPAYPGVPFQTDGQTAATRDAFRDAAESAAFFTPSGTSLTQPGFLIPLPQRFAFVFNRLYSPIVYGFHAHHALSAYLKSLLYNALHPFRSV